MERGGIRHMLTSGMACVEYGIQQNTKDTDWIIHPQDLESLILMLDNCEKGSEACPWVVSYRSLFGAPLLKEYHEGGWTSHLAVYDEPKSPEHHLDFFGHPPRVRFEEIFLSDDRHLAPPLMVAQMKKTDRDKDWPMVEALSWHVGDDVAALLHFRSAEKLHAGWQNCPDEKKDELMQKRPLLRELEKGEVKLAKCLAIERMVWEQVNKSRYRRYQSEWKDFLRRWKGETGQQWPISMPFAEQHAMLSAAVARHGLPPKPLGDQKERQALIDRALIAVAEVFDNQDEIIRRLCPPPTEILP